jgi:hypothetical protein
MRGVPLREAEDWVGAVEVDPAVLRKKVQKVKPRRAVPVKSSVVDEAVFLSFPDPPDEELQKRHLSPEWAEKYTLRYSDGWCIPIRDRDGVLKGWQTKQGEKVRNRPVGVKKSLYLFGQYELPDTEEIVVVESPLDAVLCSQEGFPCVATYGSAYSQSQVALLAEYRIVHLALDNDGGGIPAQERLAADLLLAGVWVRHVRYPGHMKDFGDDPYRIRPLIRSSIHPVQEQLNKIRNGYST